MEILGEAICLRIAEIAAVKAVQEIDHDAEWQDEKIELAI